MAARESVRSMMVAVLACTAVAACEDRGPPDDVPHARTGGSARRPGPGTESTSRIGVGDVGDGTDGSPSGASGISGGPQGAGGRAGAGAGGSAGIPGAVGVGGNAGIPAPTTSDPEDATAGDAVGVGDDTGDGASASGRGGTSGATGVLGIGGAVGGVGTNFAPTASFTVSPPCTSELQTAVTLASSSVDPDGDSLRCSWAVPGAVPNSSEDCTVTVTFFDALESTVVLFVDDGTRVSTATAEIVPCSLSPSPR